MVNFNKKNKKWQIWTKISLCSI